MLQYNKKYLGIKAKLVLLITCLLIGSTFILGTISFLKMSNAYDNRILEIRKGFDIKIQTAVENIIGVLEVNHQRYLNGELTEQEALKNAEKIVRETKYDNGEGYFWADAADGTCTVHMNPDNEGAMRYDFKDSHGIYYVRNLIEAGNKEKGGFTEFYYNKPGASDDVKKRAFTMFSKPDGWYISTGNYYDKIDTSIAKIQKEKLRAELLILLTSLAICILGIVLAYQFAKKIANPITMVTKRLSLLSEGDVKTEPSPVSQSMDETGSLTKAAESVILQIREIIGDITKQLQKISEGDMTTAITHEYIGDYLPILESIQSIKGSLNFTLTAIETTAGQVSSSAEQIASMSQYLASGSTEQSSTMESISHSIEKISNFAKENAKNASSVSEEVEDTMASIQMSEEEMKKMLESMSEISHAANEISKITSLIESIAFQTNILALNASIEAARAGVQGKGFAVVAEEVRVLAEKSSDAAHQTEQLINSSQKAVSDGSQITNNMSVMIENSVQMMQKSKEAITEIGIKSKEQAEAMGEIFESISKISTVIQSNAATAEESSASSEELSAQSSILYDELEKFTLSK